MAQFKGEEMDVRATEEALNHIEHLKEKYGQKSGDKCFVSIFAGFLVRFWRPGGPGPVQKVSWRRYA